MRVGLKQNERLVPRSTNGDLLRREKEIRGVILFLVEIDRSVEKP